MIALFRRIYNPLTLANTMIEIERKFLVLSNTFKTEAYKKTKIIQGYLNSNKQRTVRIRIKGDKAFLTVKGLSSKSGISRFEWEKEIPKEEANSLLLLCEKGLIDKIRYEIKVGASIFEVDEFYGDNEKLIIAEIELDHENAKFIKPEWLGKEVTGQTRYYNTELIKKPFKLWGASPID